MVGGEEEARTVSAERELEQQEKELVTERESLRRRVAEPPASAREALPKREAQRARLPVGRELCRVSEVPRTRGQVP